MPTNRNIACSAARNAGSPSTLQEFTSDGWKGFVMSTDTLHRTSVRDHGRRTVAQLIAAAQKDTDPVSVFMDGCNAGDTEAAIFVVKGPEQIAYLKAICERQGLLSSKAVVG